jgi:putative ABC transport system substrate-binding protein
MIARREFITLFGGAAAAWPLAARAQQGERVRRIGVLWGGTEDDLRPALLEFGQTLERLGWPEGRNVRIDHRFVAARPALFEAFAKELIALQPDVILATTTPATAALQREGSAIPIVFLNVSDPIGSGFIASLARPGGNFTGLSYIEIYRGEHRGQVAGDAQGDRAAPRAGRFHGQPQDDPL